MKLTVRSPNGDKFDQEASEDITVLDFKELISKTVNIPAAQQRLIYRGRVLKDPKTLKESEVQEGYAIHLVKGAPVKSDSGTTPSSTTTTTTTTSSSTTAPPPSSTSSTSSSTTSGTFPSSDTSNANPFNMFGGANTGMGSGFGGMGGMPNLSPEQMEQAMNNPFVQNMLNNPELVRQMMMANPQMREIIQNNPEIGRVLSDPEMLRRTMEISRNPNLMREMMRNSDRAMSNIEGMPGGFDALRRLYTDVQQPLHEATTNMTNQESSTENQQDTANNPFAAFFPQPGNTNTGNTNTSGTTGNANTNTNPLPNPWGGGAQQQGGANTGNEQNPFNMFGGGMGGMGGFGGGMGGMGGMNPQQMQQMMQNPLMQQMMQQIMNDPQALQQIINSNPMLQQMAQTNPMMQQMMSNPQLMQQMMQMQQMMFNPQPGTTGGGDTNTSTTGTTGTTTTGGANANPFADAIRNMMMNQGGMGGMGGGMDNPFGYGNFGGFGGGQPQQQQSNVPPTELYATQLQQLKDMGFFNETQNIRALQATGGNVNAAVDWLLNNGGL